MNQLIYKDSTKELTLEDALLCYEHGIALAVNDGKDITVSIEWR